MQEPNALVLEILRQEKRLAMSLFEQEKLVATLRHYSQCPVEFAEIEKLCQEVISILSKTDRTGALEPDLIRDLKKTGQLLWDHLLTRPVKDKLKTTKILDLILSIDEELIDIPWELLYDGTNFLCLDFNLGRLIRTREQAAPVEYRDSPGVLKMLILANPTNDLKSAYLEGVNIRNQFDRKRNSVLIDFKSTSIDKLYVKKNLCDYDIVHFAGHCEYDTEAPENTGWVLNDGKFTAHDILAMGSTASLPALIFSNACHSAKNSGNSRYSDYREKNYSLASAFLFSGVRHYLGSIRKMEDTMSLAFAKEFYAHLISGETVGESVRLSRLSLIKQYGITAIHWAGYLLYGDPNFVLFRTKARQAALKSKRDIRSLKKIIARFSLAVSLAALGIYLYMWLPTINPNTYFLFLRSQKLFHEGGNREVISLTQRIIKKDPLFLAAYPLLAGTYQRLGEPGEALKYYFDYALYSEKRGDRKNLASAYNSIGWIYHLQGQYPKAFDFYNKAITVSRENRDRLNEAVALRKLAVWYIDKKDYGRALELLTKSSEINRQRQYLYEHRYNLACDYFDIGLVFSNKDDFAAAREFYDKSRLIFDKLKLKNEISDCYFNTGEVFLFEKQYQKALDYYLKGLAIDKLQDNRSNLAGDYNMLGELYMEMDNWREAENFFNQAVLISQEINARADLAGAYYDLGLLYKKLGRKNKAREYFRQAQEIYRVIDVSLYQEIKEELLGIDSPRIK
jgi:CHAT domain-containing protein/tetratricopeptide (TPR) repeat protein